MQKRVIYLVRHGSILADPQQEHRYIGQLDFPLSGEGIRQAQELRDIFAGGDVTTMFCSDLKRSVETARIIAETIKVSVSIRSDLREINMGIWEGKTIHEIVADYPAEYEARGHDLAKYRIPGGETFQEAQERITTAFLSMLTVSEGNLLIVGHAGINRLLLCKFLGMPLKNLFHIYQDYGCVNVLIGKEEQYRVKLLNGIMRKESLFQ